jgi:hypothetical protein
MTYSKKSRGRIGGASRIALPLALFVKFFEIDRENLELTMNCNVKCRVQPLSPDP